MKLSPDNIQAIKEVAADLGTDPNWLQKLIYFETAGSFNPQISNPTSSAKGLIQFMNATARDMGFKDSADLVNKYPDFTSQMKGPVTQYLSKLAPFPSEQSLYMGVFYPAYRNKPAQTPFPAHVRAANPGIKTPADYIAWVRKRAAGLANIENGDIQDTLLVLLIAGLIYLYYKKG